MLWFMMLMLIAVAVAAGAVEYLFFTQRKLTGDRAAPGDDLVEGEGRRISLLAESLAYVGALLVLVGSAIATQQRWLHISSQARVVVFAVAALVLLIGGFAVRWAVSPPHRLTEVLWLASAANVAGAAATATHGVDGRAVSVTALAVSAAVAIYSGVLWLLCRRELLMVAAFAGLVGTVCTGIIVTATHSAPWLAAALTFWLFGLAWTVLGWLYAEPLGTSMTLGAAIALAGPALAVHEFGWMYAIGVATAVALMLASVPLKNVVMIAFASCALCGYLTAAILRYADRTLGIAETLMLAGALFIGLALVTFRLGRATRDDETRTERPTHGSARRGYTSHRKARPA